MKTYYFPKREITGLKSDYSLEGPWTNFRDITIEVISKKSKTIETISYYSASKKGINTELSEKLQDKKFL
jgi:hypothetical protein